MYQNLSDKEFLHLICNSEDKLGIDYIEEAKTRREVVIPFMCDVLTKESNYRFKDKRFWGVIHATHVLGILGDIRAFDTFILAGKFSHAHGIDWIWEALPECYLRLGKGVIPKLMSHIEIFKAMDYDSVVEEMLGLWNLWEASSEERHGIEDFLLQVLKAPETDLVTRTNLIADFAQLGRRDLKPLFQDFYERGEVDLDTLGSDDMERFFESIHEAPAYHYDLERFYSGEAIEARQRRWKEEKEGLKKKTVEDFILDNLNRISQNDPCPCGSGMKFKKCHLLWAEQERVRSREKKALEEEQEKIGFAIFSERRAETDLRRFLTKKGQTGLFSELKARVLEAIKAPTDEFKSKGFLSYFEPIFSVLEFKDKEEMKEFIGIFMEYFDALSQQHACLPRDRGLLH